MSLSAAAIRLMADKGLTAIEIAEIAEANEPARSSSAVRQQRYRDRIAAERNERDVTRDVTPPPNDIYSNPPDPVEAKASTPPYAEQVVSAWNTGPAANGAQAAKALTPKRRKHLAARVREFGEDGVLAAIRSLGGSDWHCGRGSSAWRADLGWLLENGERVAKFVERGASSPDAPKPMSSDAQSAYLEKLRSAPHLRGLNTVDMPRGGGGGGPPRSFAQLAGGIASEGRGL